MVNISLQFLAGGFHATPWGRQVNEEAVEWPPSQWRILRALIAVWHLKLRDEISRQILSDIIELLSDPPEYSLPRASVLVKRHYMPGGHLKRKKDEDTGESRKIPEKNMILDTVVKIDKSDRVFVYWKDAEANAEQKEALGKLLRGLAYLGRAESWVSAKLEQEPPQNINCSLTHLPGTERVATACTLSLEEFMRWRQQAAYEALDGILAEKKQKLFDKNRDAKKAKTTKVDIRKASEKVPYTILEALETSTAAIKKNAWSSTPGMRFVTYHRPVNCFETQNVSLPAPHKKVSAVRFVVSSAVLPPLTDAISVGERIRVAAMSAAGRLNEKNVPWVLSGKTEDGKPLQKGHLHSYYLSESLRGNGRISHITVFARGEFDRVSLAALLSLRKVWGRDGYDLKLVPLETGNPEELGMVERGGTPILAKSEIWESITPFYPTRNPKLNSAQRKDPYQRHSLMQEYYRHEALRELRNAGFTGSVDIEVLQTRGIEIDGHLTSCLKFNTKRRGFGKMAHTLPVVLRLSFAEPVQGPVSIGYGAHFGLGLFRPLPEKGV